MRNTRKFVALGILASAGLVLAQDAQTPPPPPPPPADAPAQPPQDGGWRRIGDASSQTSPQTGPQGVPAPPPPAYNPGPVPAQLTLKQGSYLTVRINQPLSSDKNQQGDAFSATLEQPLIVDGVVVAQRGQTLGGHVVEAKKAGRVEGTSRLGIQLSDLTLVDGQVVPIQSQLISRNGPTSVGRDAGAVAGTTALGAVIGAAAGWGRGAAIGAGAGAAAGLAGVLLTRGHPTIIGPESVLTFRVEAPVTISTERSSQAFRYAEPQDYNRPALATRPPYPPRPAYYTGYPYPYYPNYWGPGYYYGPGIVFRGRFR